MRCSLARPWHIENAFRAPQMHFERLSTVQAPNLGLSLDEKSPDAWFELRGGTVELQSLDIGSGARTSESRPPGKDCSAATWPARFSPTSRRRSNGGGVRHARGNARRSARGRTPFNRRCPPAGRSPSSCPGFLPARIVWKPWRNRPQTPHEHLPCDALRLLHRKLDGLRNLQLIGPVHRLHPGTRSGGDGDVADHRQLPAQACVAGVDVHFTGLVVDLHVSEKPYCERSRSAPREKRWRPRRRDVDLVRIGRGRGLREKDQCHGDHRCHYGKTVFHSLHINPHACSSPCEWSPLKLVAP
jgi:hypothetical protein